MKTKQIFISLLSMTLLLLSCENKRNNYVYESKHDDKQELNNTLEKANRYMILKESELIDDYIYRHDLNMYETGTGLRYQILKQGETELIKEGDLVTMEYELRFLTGDLVYSSKESGNKSFIVGRGGVEAGLEEAVLKLHKNDMAIVIIPAHLAHGLLGDGNRIPPRSTLVYRIKII